MYSVLKFSGLYTSVILLTLPVTTLYRISLCSLWGTLLADVVIQMLGTDYARIVRAIYAFAQVMCYHA